MATASAPVEQAPAATPSAFETAIGNVIARPNGLTADRIAARAVATSFDVRARHAEVAAASAAVDQALVGYFPRVTVSARYARLSDITPPTFGNLVAAPGAPPGPIADGTQLVNVPLAIPVVLNQTSFQASLNVPLSDYLLRISQQHAAASHSLRAASLNERATRLRAGIDARIAWWSLVRARLASVVADLGVAQAQAHLADVQHMEAAGAVSEADVVRVRSQLASASLLALRARDLALVLEDQVRTAMHVDGGAIDIADDIRIDLPPLDRQGDFASLFDEAMTNRPELQSLAETIGGLRQQATIARAVAYPRLDAFADVISANPNPRVFPPTAVFTTTWDVGVGLSWSPNDIANGLTAGRTVSARAEAMEAQRAGLRDQLRSEVMSTFTAVRDADEAIRTTAAGLSAAEESYRVRNVLFRNGRATSVELTDAEQDLTRARLESLNARVDLRLARARLEHAIGRDARR